MRSHQVLHLKRAERVFKTAWFTKASKKAHITDKELCFAISQVKLGQADDLGGGVYKKRLGKNLYRSIIVAKGGRYWVYTYLFAKKDQANIDEDDLVLLRRQADVYSGKSEVDVDRDLKAKEIVEICHVQESQIQE